MQWRRWKRFFPWLGAALAIAVAVVLLVPPARYWAEGFAELERGYRQEGIEPPSHLRPVLDSDIDRVAGEIVFLNDVKLEAGPATNVFFVVGGRGARMLVVTSRPDVKPRKRADVTAIIHRLPSEWIMRKQWKLSPQQIKTVRGQAMYLEAVSIEPGQRGKTSPTHPSPASAIPKS